MASLGLAAGSRRRCWRRGRGLPRRRAAARSATTPSRSAVTSTSSQAARPVPEWLADPATPPRAEGTARAVAAHPRLRRQRAAAARQRQLPPLRRPEARRGGLERRRGARAVADAEDLVLPVVGCVGYRGYYDARRAPRRWPRRCARRAARSRVYPVPAYSTLGGCPATGSADPLLNTFIDYPEGELARLIFHELAHQVAYAPGDTLFNESFATAVEKHRRRALARPARETPEARGRPRPRRGAPRRLPRADAALPRRAAGAVRRARARRRRSARRKAALLRARCAPTTRR